MLTGFTVDDAVARGVSQPGEPDGAVQTFFDKTFAFVRLRVKDGVAREVESGPWRPPERKRP